MTSRNPSRAPTRQRMVSEMGRAQRDGLGLLDFGKHTQDYVSSRRRSPDCLGQNCPHQNVLVNIETKHQKYNVIQRAVNSSMDHPL